MSFKCEDELRDRAEAFISALARVGITAEIVPGSARDYLIKVALSRSGQKYGHVNLYSRASKKEFSLRSHELRDPTILPDVEACWATLAVAGQKSPPEPAMSLGIQAYVDGSWAEGGIGYGVVILRDGVLAAELSGRVDDPNSEGMRQIGGELKAVSVAINWCRENAVRNVTVCYDYDGIQKWAEGEWGAQKPATQAYARMIQSCDVSISWQKIAAHSGDPWNERADHLAKLGATQAQKDQVPPTNPIAVLEDHAQALIVMLVEHGIEASLARIVNKEVARVILEGQQGIIDLYNTRNRPLGRPYLHDFVDKALEERIEALWRIQISGHDRAQEPHLLDEVTYYYRILAPYRNCAFDFYSLAAAVDRAYRQVKGSGIDIESNRYDFQVLEALVLDLKGDR
jgi:ribonuclease HI